MGPMRWHAAVVAAVLLAGCGGGEAPAPTGPAPVVSVPQPAAVSLQAPADGAVVRARRAADGTLRGRVTVRGEAAAGASIALSASCSPRDCERTVVAGPDGRFATTLPVRVEGRPSLSLSASPAGGGGTPAIVLVSLRAPAPRGAPAGTGTISAPQRESPVPTTPAPPQPRTVAVVGDSLAEGTEPLLPGLLPGWAITSDAKASRPLATGMAIVRALRRPDVLAVSLFTNDDPGATAALEDAVREAAGRAGCVVWATIVRPPFGGRSYAAANRVLERLQAELAGRLVLVPWARQVATHPEWLTPDGVHGTPEGYRARAQLFARAIRSCSR